MTTVYFVRHCKATGQEADAALTGQGAEDAERLADFFADKPIDVIVSSPYTRAVHTIRPFAEKTGRQIHLDERLKERVLSGVQLDNWMSKLASTYEQLDLKFEGGESSNEAMSRAIGLIEQLQARDESTFVIVTHGALLSLIVKHYIPAFGFEDWRSLTNPDVYKLEIAHGECAISRVWQ